MIKHILLILSIIVGTVAAHTHELNVINSLISVKESVFNEDGNLSSSQKPKEYSLSGQTVNLYVSDGEIIGMRRRKGEKMPFSISAFSKETKESLLISLDNEGKVQGLTKCDNTDCATVSKEFCQRSVNQNKAGSKDANNSIIQPTPEELKGLEDLTNRYISETQKEYKPVLIPNFFSPRKEKDYQTPFRDLVEKTKTQWVNENYQISEKAIKKLRAKKGPQENIYNNKMAKQLCGNLIAPAGPTHPKPQPAEPAVQR